jgi:hypothetical protein
MDEVIEVIKGSCMVMYGRCDDVTMSARPPALTAARGRSC